MLQWSRVRLNAESRKAGLLRFLTGGLQWSRVRLNAESAAAIGVDDYALPLQWSRVRLNAESSRCGSGIDSLSGFNGAAFV